MRVLYVDDDRLNALLFVEACRVVSAEAEVETAGSGGDALALVGGWHPDLLVLDLHLPDTNGYALLPLLRARLPAPPVRALLCTADEPALVAEQARAAGFDGCWTKPVALATVRAELSRPAT